MEAEMVAGIAFAFLFFWVPSNAVLTMSSLAAEHFMRRCSDIFVALNVPFKEVAAIRLQWTQIKITFSGLLLSTVN